MTADNNNDLDDCNL